MAGTPPYKIYTADGEYVASVAYLEDAAAFAAFRGDGTTVRLAHAKRWTLWTEGKDGHAGESYDLAASHMLAEERRLQQAAYDDAHPKRNRS